jgi:hypothetical protein
MNHSNDKVSTVSEKDLAILEVGLPASLSASTVDLDPVAEKRLVKKLDWILMPMFTLICMLNSHMSIQSLSSANPYIVGLNFIDRTAIGMLCFFAYP